MNPKAFPSTYDPATGRIETGMTLRDYFAARAMQVIEDASSMEELARLAYQLADAMVAERDK